jgi:hypothetical protein
VQRVQRFGVLLHRSCVQPMLLIGRLPFGEAAAQRLNFFLQLSFRGADFGHDGE